MDVTVDLACKLGTGMPQGLSTLEILRQAEADGYAARDMASILTYMRKRKI